MILCIYFNGSPLRNNCNALCRYNFLVLRSTTKKVIVMRKKIKCSFVQGDCVSMKCLIRISQNLVMTSSSVISISKSERVAFVLSGSSKISIIAICRSHNSLKAFEKGIKFPTFYYVWDPFWESINGILKSNLIKHSRSLFQRKQQ